MEVTCVVDDAVRRSSAFWGEHGVAFLIETKDGRALFDTGQNGTILMHNLDLLGVDPGTIDAVAISHGHYDHTGGLSALLELLPAGTPLYAHPDLFRERYSVRDGEKKNVGIPLTRGSLAAGMSLQLSADAQEVLPDVWTKGQITRRDGKEGSSSHHRMRERGVLVQDRYLDDMALVLESEGQLVLLCGCCHAGLLNTVACAESAFGAPIRMIAGGLHLTGATEDELAHICRALNEQPVLQAICPNHCTGEAAFVALTNALGSPAVHPFPAGTTVEI
jgi:7,8-dihydropterin-6-yl-methyl-4-(beta-D-ribofuranosyl)aminobenzene 5'-phosphate synthase